MLWIIGYCTQIYRCFCIRTLDTAPRSIGVFASEYWIQHPDLSVFLHQNIGYSTQIYRCFCIRILDTAPRSIGVFASEYWILHPDLSVFLHQNIGYSTQIYRCFCIRTLDTAPGSIGVFASEHWIQHPDLSGFLHQNIGYSTRIYRCFCIRTLDTAPGSIGVFAPDHWIQHPEPDVLVTAAVKKAEGQTDNTVQIQEQSANIHSKQAPTSGNRMKGHRQPSPCSFDTPFRQQTFPRTIPGWNSLPEAVVDSPISGLL